MQPSNSLDDLSQNMPAIGMMFLMNTSLFGNTGFQIQPSQTGEVSNSFGTIPYMSPEAIMYMGQIQSATNQANTISNQMTGQQNVTGGLTVTDNSGNIVAQISSGNIPYTGSAPTSQQVG